MSDHPIYTYVSTKAGYDPAKTYYVCAPAKYAATLKGAEQFAQDSGWREAAEEQGGILVMPIAAQGWEKLPDSLFMDIYGETRNKFHTRSGKAPWGRQGGLWCWETVIYLAGYGEGAKFAGRVLVKYPGQFAAAALVGGAPTDFSAGDLPSNHLFVRNVSPSYCKENRDIPVCLWMLGCGDQAGQAASYFSQCGSSENIQPVVSLLAGYDTQLWQAKKNPAHQVRVFSGTFEASPSLTKLIAEELFSHVVRWKDGPDGSLDWIDNRAEFYRDSRFIKHTVTANGNDYDFFVHLPTGMSREDVAGLPLVFTVHGRGEPAWMFTTKNGWDKLADETREFVVISPDSPGNIWFLDRDGEAFPAMVHTMEEIYHIDITRVYLTGFSNGGMMVREVGIRYPHLFAGVSPWNAPRMDSLTLHKEDSPVIPDRFGPEMEGVVSKFAADGFELPYYFCYGDSDPAASPKENLLLDAILKANGCTGEAVCADNSVQYTKEAGYAQGERLSTVFYLREDGTARVAVTTMKDMPHGAIHDESRAVWSFLKRFRRLGNTKNITIYSNTVPTPPGTGTGKNEKQIFQYF